MRERYTLSEMRNKGVKTKSRRCDSDKGRRGRRGRELWGSATFVHPLRRKPGLWRTTHTHVVLWFITAHRMPDEWGEEWEQRSERGKMQKIRRIKLREVEL